MGRSCLLIGLKVMTFVDIKSILWVYAGLFLFLFLVPMKIGFIGFIYKFVSLLPSYHSIITILFIANFVSIIIGSLGSLTQDNIAKFLG